MSVSRFGYGADDLLSDHESAERIRVTFLVDDSMGAHGQAEQLAMGDQPESFSEHDDVSNNGLSTGTTENLDSPAGGQ